MSEIVPEPAEGLVVFVNGKKAACDSVDPRTTLLQFLRSSGLVGTKLGCGEGGCGACTVMISSYDRSESKIRHISANACLTPLCSVNGCHVTTVEGIGGTRGGLHPVQKRIAALHGSQCGFCTPGIVMALYTIFRSNPQASPHDIEESLDGNLCRCTGYRPILDAAKSLSNNKGCSNASSSGSCCQGSGGSCPCKEAASSAMIDESDLQNGMIKSTTEEIVRNSVGVEEELSKQSKSEPIFPPALMRFVPVDLLLSKNGYTWFQPVNLSSLLSYKFRYPSAKIVVGNSEIGIETKFKGLDYQYYLNPSYIPELTSLNTESTGVRIGAAVTLNKFRQFILALGSENFKYRSLNAMADMLRWFASNHIRNVASLGGNLATASPISDMNPLLFAAGAVLKLVSWSDSGSLIEREVPVSQFFKSYRVVDMLPTEIIKDIFIPFTTEFEFFVPLKQARRREDDISIVTAGVRMRLAPNSVGYTIEDCGIAYGGMAPTTVTVPRTLKLLIGQTWSEDTLKSACDEMLRELSLPDSVPGGQAAFRMCLAASFLYRSFLKINAELMGNRGEDSFSIDKSGSSSFVTEPKVLSRGEQSFFQRAGGLCDSTHAAAGDAATDRRPVGESIQHKSSEIQCSGEAKYTDDIPSPMGTGYAALVMSSRAHANIKKIDYTKCRASSGFIAVFDHNDIQGENKCGPIFHDEEVFVSSEVKHVGQVIAIVVARSHEEALAASKLVIVEYEDLPAIISIQDAIKAKSFMLAEPLELLDGDLQNRELESDVIVSGEINIGGQEHFYLETNSCLAIPTENGSMEIFASTQNANETQLACAHACNISANHVVCRVKRIGGGFGGKETRSLVFTTPTAVAAHALGIPVRINIDRDVDMQVSGQRHAFHGKYRAGCTLSGKLKFLDVALYSNAGFSFDLSEPVLSRALLHVDNTYKWPALHATGQLCRTNQPSHTAFRGFGGPQGMYVTETVIEHLSSALRERNVANASSFWLRSNNFYATGDETHFGEVIEQFNVPEAWERILRTAEVERREAEIELFNTQHKWKKRALSIIPTKYGINYTAKFMNQAGALVHIYSDGTVLVSHGGMEMGQGVHTKMCQVVARALEIPFELVHISETSTNVVANAQATAGSMTTDMYGMALLNACEQLNARLTPLKNSNPKASWKEIITTAYFSRVDLTAHGFYKVPDERCGFDWRKKVISHNSERGTPFNYFTQGVACAEVEIDLLSGDLIVRRADVVMDVGQSINPAIDVGQIEGAFVQGFGWSTMEELIWGDDDHKWVRPGNLFTRGPGTYKIPSFNDVPEDFRIHLMDKSNKRAVHSSKGIGEPPFFMGTSVLFAARNALMKVRCEFGLNDYFRLNLPATSERIRMLVPDEIAVKTVGNIEQLHSYQPHGSW